MPLFNEKKLRYFRVVPEEDHPINVDITGENFLENVNASDISETGIGIVVPHRFKGCEIDNEVSVVISIPYPVRKSFLVRGNIRHVSDNRFGITFIDLSKPDRKLIRKYIEQRLRDNSFVERFWYRYLSFRLRHRYVTASLVIILLVALVYAYHAQYFRHGPKPKDKGNSLTLNSLPEKKAEENSASTHTKYALNLPVGQMAIRSRWGVKLSETPAVLMSGKWVALPFRACLGGDNWEFSFNQALSGVQGGVWSAGFRVGLWRLKRIKSQENPHLFPWTPDQPLQWVSLEPGALPKAIEVQKKREEGQYFICTTAESVNQNGVFIQNQNIVGWTFSQYPGECYLWVGPDGESLETQIDMDVFYRTSFEGGREEQLLKALEMKPTISPVERLEAFSQAFRRWPVLATEDTPSILHPDAIEKTILELVGEMMKNEMYSEIVEALDDSVILEIPSTALFIQKVNAVAMVKGLNSAINMIEEMKGYFQSISKEDKKQIDALHVQMYLNLIREYVENGNLDSAWLAYEACSEIFPENPGVYLAGVDLTLRRDGWAEAERLLAAKDIPPAFMGQVDALKAEIEKRKKEPGKIMIRFTPESEQIVIDAVINGSFRQKFLVDTGASMVTLPHSAIEALGLEIDEDSPVRTINTANGTRRARQVMLASIDVEGWVENNVEALVLEDSDEDDMALLGLNYLKRFHMEINNEEGMITLSPTGTAKEYE
jgi:clan AA aspartic protease (TIGR02281 family)